MSLRLRMIYGCLTGAWGGFFAWIILDVLLGWFPASAYVDALLNGAVIGLCVGAMMGGFLGLIERDLRRAASGLGIGTLTGLVGGMVGLLVGELMFQLSGQVVALRIAGWALFGFALGVSEGLVTRSWRRALFGAIGGAAGGLLGSLAFIAERNQLTLPAFSRALGFTILGALLGLFIGLVPVMIGWIGGSLKVVSSGRNEGKEITLEKKVVRIGRDDTCDLKLLADGQIAPVHVEIRREKAGYVLHPNGGATVRVNGQPVASHVLQKGDRIQVEREEIVFK
jgi:hypothetical protein